MRDENLLEGDEGESVVVVVVGGRCGWVWCSIPHNYDRRMVESKVVVGKLVGVVGVVDEQESKVVVVGGKGDLHLCIDAVRRRRSTGGTPKVDAWRRWGKKKRSCAGLDEERGCCCC